MLVSRGTSWVSRHLLYHVPDPFVLEHLLVFLVTETSSGLLH